MSQMKHFPHSLLLAGLLIASCKEEKKMTPLEFGKMIEATDDSLKGMGMRWTGALERSFETGDYTALKPIRDSISGFIDLKIKEIGSVPDVGGSEKLKNAELELLKYERKMVDSSFVIFESFNAKTPQMDLAFATQDIMDYSAKEEEVVTKVREAQKEYAEKHHFNVQK